MTRRYRTETTERVESSEELLQELRAELLRRYGRGVAGLVAQWRAVLKWLAYQEPVAGERFLDHLRGACERGQQ